MNIRVRTLATAVAAVAMTTSLATAQEGRERDSRQRDRDQPQRSVAKVGEQAPNFTLKDADGKEYKLSDQKGKIVVLQWINPGCPVCKRVTSKGLVAEMMADVKAMSPDTVFWAINSTKETEPSVSKSYLAEHKLAVPGLSDVNGRVGKRYGARTTPHMYVIDGKGVLRYAGAIDDDPRGGKADATNYVVNAVGQIVAGETVAPDTTRPYGCSVKYAASDRPQREARGEGRGEGRGRPPRSHEPRGDAEGLRLRRRRQAQRQRASRRVRSNVGRDARAHAGAHPRPLRRGRRRQDQLRRA